MLLRLRLALASSPRAQFWLLWGFFFCAETSSYLLGVLASTILVKRAGAAQLPNAYLCLNAVFLPVVLAVLARPPRSSLSAARVSLAVYLLATLATLPGVASSDVRVLIAIYVIARLGKLIWSTFAVGMIAEILPLREAKKSAPALLAAASAGIVLAGVLLDRALSAVGITAAFAVLWVLLACALGMLMLLEPGHAQPKAPPVRRSLTTALPQMLSMPLARIIGMQNLFVVGLRYFIEYVYAAALSREFASEREMAGFAGVFEATLQVSTALVQVSLIGPVMRRMGVGGMAMLMPALLVMTTGAAAFHDGFWVILACQFLFWVGSDGLNKPVRQVMVGALPRESVSSVPVLMAALGMSGSLAASTMLVLLARLGSSSLVMLCACGLSVAFLLASLTVGRIYRTTLWRTLQASGDAQPAEDGPSVEGARYATVSAMLESPEPELRFQAVRQASELPAAEAAALLLRQASAEPDAKVRSALLSSLAALGVPEARPIFQSALADPDARVRSTALEALAGHKGDESLLPAIERALESEDMRERAAAIVSAVRVGNSPELLGRALDLLAAMARTSGDTRARSAAAFSLGRLGYPFLLPALEELLADPEPSVRRSAAEALLQTHAGVALPILAEAMARETDEKLAERMRQAASDLRDENVRSILDISGHLTGAERAQISELLARNPGDRKLAVLKDGVLIEQTAVRSALVELVHQTRDPAVLDALAKGLQAGALERRLELSPVLEELSVWPPEATLEVVEALPKLMSRPDEPSVCRHLSRIARGFWEGSGPGPLQHLFTVAAATTRRPERALEAMRAASGSDRYGASLSIELLEQWLPAPVARVVLPVLEAAMEPAIAPETARKALADLEAAGV